MITVSRATLQHQGISLAGILSKDEHITILEEQIRVLKKAMFGALSTGMLRGNKPKISHV